VINIILVSEEIEIAISIQKGWTSFRVKILHSQSLVKNCTSTLFCDLKVLNEI
jgi:hypothetical protein